MSKDPFEKIRSLVERRKLFEQLIAQQGEIICKGSDDSLFSLRPTRLIDEEKVEGEIIIVEKLPTGNVDVLGNFAVGTDRYFFTGNLEVRGSHGVISAQCDVFLLQRRASFRLGIKPQWGLFMAVTGLQGRAMYIIAHVADISAGGARIYFSETHSTSGITGTSKDPGLKLGSRFTAVVHPPSGKNLEVTCEVRHSQKAVVHDQMVEQFGVEFIEFDHRLKNRLVAMTMDLQQKMIQRAE